MKISVGMLGILVILSVSCGSSSGDDSDRAAEDGAAAKRCNDLREHMIDLRLAPSANADGVDLAPHRLALRNALGQRFLDHCVAAMTPEQVECALGAKDSATVGACSQLSPALARTP